MSPITRQAVKRARYVDGYAAPTEDDWTIRISASSRFTKSIWSRIIESCEEQGQEGAFVPQPTLVNLMTVSRSMLMKTIPILYRNAVIRDVGAFFDGIETYLPYIYPPRWTKPRLSWFYFDWRLTKLLGLLYLERLTIIPYTTDTYRPEFQSRASDDERAIYLKQRLSYERAILAFKRLEAIVERDHATNPAAPPTRPAILITPGLRD
ncbi:uncharacterized protein I303_107788 [Kwoniella dejecticola CBS 10117]|uniref:Uncharacterized protein n=1 Tax=Kwoniella dejecticola CBS 10117 TaxID=1296121 RepID=A0AAJ8KVK1_9TREE